VLIYIYTNYNEAIKMIKYTLEYHGVHYTGTQNEITEFLMGYCDSLVTTAKHKAILFELYSEIEVEEVYAYELESLDNTSIYVVVVEYPDCTHNKISPIVCETPINKSSISDAMRKVASMGKAYGKKRIARLQYVS
jgi:hypothetical protein